MQNTNFSEITLQRTDRIWLYQWSGNGKRFYPINQANVRYLAGTAEYVRNAFNAAILGLKVHVRGVYNRESRILTIEP